jgi:hypothetical protein
MPTVYLAARGIRDTPTHTCTYPVDALLERHIRHHAEEIRLPLQGRILDERHLIRLILLND